MNTDKQTTKSTQRPAECILCKFLHSVLVCFGTTDLPMGTNTDLRIKDIDPLMPEFKSFPRPHPQDKKYQLG